MSDTVLTLLILLILLSLLFLVLTLLGLAQQQSDCQPLYLCELLVAFVSWVEEVLYFGHHELSDPQEPHARTDFVSEG